jgi:hypothetical protein
MTSPSKVTARKKAESTIRIFKFPDDLRDDRTITFIPKRVAKATESIKNTIPGTAGAINFVTNSANLVVKYTTGGSIVLPLPQNIQTTDNFEYADFSGGFLESVLNKGNSNSSALQKGVSSATELGGRVAFNSLGENGSLLQQKVGIAFNPRQSTVFKSPSLKLYQFRFPMIARSSRDSTMIDNIVNLFRFHAHPNVYVGSDDSIFDPPELFEISLNPSEYLFDIKSECALVNINVTYNGSTSPVFFESTGAPVEVELNLEFKETKTMTKLDFTARLDGVI